MSKEDLLAKLKSKTIITEDGHWKWTGGKNAGGYGYTTYKSKLYPVHRLSCHIYHELDLDSNKMGLHKNECNIRSCWNPEHLYVGTAHDNMQDRKLLNPQDTSMCQSKLHPMTPDNVYRAPKTGKLNCKACRNINSRRFRDRERLKRLQNA